MAVGRKHDCERAFELARFVETHFADARIYEAACLFLAERKGLIGGNIQSKCGIINQYKTVLRMFFGKTALEEITRQYILSKLEEHPGQWKLRLHFMWEFLFSLKDSGGLNKEWKQLEHLRNRLCANSSGGFSKAVLSVADSSRCRLLQFGINTRLYYLDSGNRLIQELMVNFLNKRDRLPDDSDHIFSFLFETQEIHLDSIEDINYNLFCKQINLLNENKGRKKYFAQLIAFYRFIYANYNSNLFAETTEFDTRLLQRKGLASEIAEGYRVVMYNPLEAYPRHDRWIVNFYNLNEQYGNHITLTCKVDFTKVKSGDYRGYLKEYLWSSPLAWKTKIATISNIMYFLNYISDLKSGKELTIFTKKTTDEIFRVEEIAAFRQHIVSKYPNLKTQGHNLSNAAAFLKYCRDINVIPLGNGILEHLKTKLVRSSDKAPVSDDDLKKLSATMSRYASDTPKYALYYSVFYLALETEFRISQLVNLDAECVRETMKSGQYVVVSKTKNSYGEYKEQAVTSYTKQHLDEIKRLTEPFRRNCPDKRMNQLLFLEPYKQTENMFRPLSAERFNKHLKTCCEEAGISPITFSNLRDTHMTKAEEFVMRKGLSDMYLRVLTDHKDPETTRRHYSQMELTEMLEAVHGIIIGDIQLDGTVLPKSDEEWSETDAVSNGCGYCASPVCVNKTYLDCLMCKHFVTMPERIPYFEEQIEMLDYKIRKTSIVRDREDFITIKRLFAAYLRALLIVRGNVEYAAND